jgi:CheY-like chemotaxis protein
MPDSREFSWKNARILIVDDEPDMRDIFGSWLRNLGCSVTTACDGRDALDALSQERFDAIVTDVRMPRVDGIELVQLLHRAGRYTPVVIFVSGFVDLPLYEAYDLGVEAVLSKPCERKELIQALKRSIQRRNMVFEPDPAAAPPAPEDVIHESFLGGPETTHVAIGRGGLSIESSGARMPGSAVGFSLHFTEGTLPVLSGWGLLRWNEVIAGRTRIGVEFMELDPASSGFFGRWIDDTCSPSFIPKLPHRNAAGASP